MKVKVKTTKILSCIIVSLCIISSFMLIEAIGHNIKAANNFIVTDETELIQAISDANDGDAIEFQNFTDSLSAPLIINKSLTFTHATPGFSLKVAGAFRHMDVSGPVINLFFNNVTLDGNNVGGGIEKATIRETLTIDGVHITNSIAANGGAIYVNERTNLTIRNSLFDYNTADSHGGAISTRMYAVVTIENTVIDHNTANGTDESGGGAHFMNYSRVTINNNSEITNNKGDSRGGGIFFGRYTINNITDLLLAHNDIATQGGGVYCDNYSNTTFVDSIVDNNSSSLNSAGILITDHAELYFSGGAITNNTAANLGGGIGAFNAATKIYMQGGTSIIGNIANTGGGIYIQQATGLADIIDTNLSGNQALTGDGGGIYVANLTNLDVDSLSTFSNNQASSSTIWTVGSAELPISSDAHNNHINTTVFTTSFLNAYNNYDINFKPNKVNFLANGGTGTDQFVYAEQTGIVSFIDNPFTPPGNKEFVMWNNQPDGRGNQSYLASETMTMGSASLNFYAIYASLPLEAIFDLNGGDSDAIPSQLLDFRDKIVKPDEPTKIGNTFSGWNTKQDGTGITWDFDTDTMPANNVTLYAQWDINSYELDFNLNGGDGTSPGTQTIEFGAIASEPANPEKQGYTFTGWNDQADGGGDTWDFLNTTMPANNVTLYAQWDINSYELDFNLNGGDGTSPGTQTIEFGAIASEPAIPEKQGYTFAGWNDQADGGGATWDFLNTTMPANNVTLYAQWLSDVDPITSHTLSFDLNGGSGLTPERQQLNIGAKAISPSNPVRVGYTFKEWNTKQDGSGMAWDFNTTTMPAENVVLYAQWVQNTLPATGDKSNALLISLLVVLTGISFVGIAKKKKLK